MIVSVPGSGWLYPRHEYSTELKCQIAMMMIAEWKFCIYNVNVIGLEILQTGFNGNMYALGTSSAIVALLYWFAGYRA